jgi:hypothetical protein
VAQFSAGQKVRASQLNEIDAVGYVGDHYPGAGVTGSGTTEKVGCFVTFPAVSGRRYRATYDADLNSSNANASSNLTTNPGEIRLRYKATSSSTDITGTVFAAHDFAGLSSGYNLPVNQVGDFVAPTTDTYTVVATFKAATGAAGNVTQAFGTTHVPNLIVECTKGV